MGKKSRDKGARREREFAKLIGGERVPLSGACGGSYVGDVVSRSGLVIEVKARKKAWTQIYSWIEPEEIDALALKADNKQWLVVLPLETFIEMEGCSPSDWEIMVKRTTLSDEELDDLPF